MAEQDTKIDSMEGGLPARARSIRWVLALTWNVAPGFLVAIVGVTLIKSMVPAALAWMAKSLIDSMTIEMASSTPDASAIMPWLWMGLTLAVLDSAGNSVRTYLGRRLADDLTLKVTTDVLAHAARLDIAFFEDVGKQDSLLRARRMTGQQFLTLITHTFEAITSGLQVVSLTAVLVVIQPWTLLVVAVITPPFLFVRWMVSRQDYALEYNRATKRRWTAYFTRLLTQNTPVAETRLLGLAPLLIRRFHALEAEFLDQNRGVYLASLRILLVFGVVSAAAFYGLLLEVTLRAMDGGATIGEVAVFFGASARLRSGLVSGADSVTGLLRPTLHASALMEFFEAESSAHPSGEPVTAECAGAIEIEKVEFAYPGSSVPVLRGLSAGIQAGEIVALVGENGCGKTTLVKLIARLYRADRGRITLDGQDIEKLEIDSLHRQIAFVFQGFSRYEATARDNIAYGDWENCLDDPERVEQIARAAGVHDMIMDMPEGYDTMLGRSFGTFDLSGGQWQKLALARAFARRSSILILDEATASLDARAEYELFTRARDLAKGRTTLLVSHRFSTVNMADRILVMDQGQIIETGTHQELVARAGHYSKLYGLHQRQMGNIQEG